MKKLMILAAAAAVVLASCAKNEVFQNTQDENAVSFSVYVPQTTRASYGTQTTATLKTDGFGVFAYYTDAASYGSSAIPNFMYNTKVTYADSKWTYSPLKYWPNNHGGAAASSDVDKVSFFAYAPHMAVTPSTGVPTTYYPAPVNQDDPKQGITAVSANGATGDPLVSFTVPSKGSEQIDLLWGVAKESNTGDLVEGTDPVVAGMPFVNMTKQKTGGSIKYLFKHALAKLDFKVQAIVDDPTANTNAVDANTKIFVRKVEVTGKFNTSGDLNLNNTTANVPLWENTTASLGTSPIYVFNDGLANSDDKTADSDESIDIAAAFINGAGVTNEAQGLLADNRQFMIVPTDLSSEGFKVTVTYDVETKDPDVSTPLTDGTTNGIKVKNVITTAEAAKVNFEAGKIYTILLKLGMTSVKMEAEVDPWGDATETPVDLPKNVD